MKKGFTLIELLLVIGILVVLIAATVVAVNPFRQFALANNANRWSGLTTIMDATYQNIIDNRGVFECAGESGGIPSTPTVMATDDGTGTDEYDICDCIVPTYVANLPRDPQDGSYTDCAAYDSGYTIERNPTSGRISLCAPSAQAPETTICVTR